MEELLHYIWKHKIFPLKELCTTTGTTIEVIDSGLPNTNAGPDFFNAKLKLNDTLWVGNVEIHTKTSDWHKHGHTNDSAYDNVILHVVNESNGQVFRKNGEEIPLRCFFIPFHPIFRVSRTSLSKYATGFWASPS